MISRRLARLAGVLLISVLSGCFRAEEAVVTEYRTVVSHDLPGPQEPVEVLVVDPEGNPVPGATVCADIVSQSCGDIDRFFMNSPVLTGSDGKATIKQGIFWPLLPLARKGDHFGYTTERSGDLRIVLYPPSRIRGRLENPPRGFDFDMHIYETRRGLHGLTVPVSPEGYEVCVLGGGPFEFFVRGVESASTQSAEPPHGQIFVKGETEAPVIDETRDFAFPEQTGGLKVRITGDFAGPAIVRLAVADAAGRYLHENSAVVRRPAHDFDWCVEGDGYLVVERPHREKRSCFVAPLHMGRDTVTMECALARAKTRHWRITPEIARTDGEPLVFYVMPEIVHEVYDRFRMPLNYHQQLKTFQVVAESADEEITFQAGAGPHVIATADDRQMMVVLDRLVLE